MVCNVPCKYSRNISICNNFIEIDGCVYIYNRNMAGTGYIITVTTSSTITYAPYLMLANGERFATIYNYVCSGLAINQEPTASNNIG